MRRTATTVLVLAAACGTDRQPPAAAEALAAYERSSELAPFSSRYDHYVAGTGSLIDKELREPAISSR